VSAQRSPLALGSASAGSAHPAPSRFRFEKVLVNGAGAHPVFAFLKARLSDVLGQSIKWNFTKFLIGKDGTPVARFSPPTAPLSFEKEIERLLAEPGIDAALRVS